MTAMAVVLLIVKVSVVLAAALLAARVSRRAPARTRHGLWSVVFAAILILPLLASAVPELRVPVPSWAPQITQQESEPIAPASLPSAAAPAHLADGTLPATIETIAATTGSDAVVRDDDARFSIAQLLALIWVSGAGIAAGALMLALLRVARLARAATEITDADWRDAAAQVGARLGLAAPVRLLMSEAVSTPMAGGVLRPTIFLPATVLDWSAERRDVVLAHETAHLAGRDPLRQILTRVAVAAYWFHPLAWIAARQSAVAREQACDEAVIALGTRPSTYARVLLEFADGLRPSVSGLAALPIVQRTLLEKRLMAILNDGARPATRRVALVFAALAALTLSVAAAQPVQGDTFGAAVAQNSSGVASQGVVGGIPAGVPAGVISGVPAGVMSGVPGGVIGGVSGGVPGVAFTGGADQSGRSACDWRGSGPFNGMTDMSRRDGRDFIHERVGRQGHDYVIQKTFDTLRVCAYARGLDQYDFQNPGAWKNNSSHVILETQEPNLTRRMEIERGTTTYSVNGQQRPVDDTARAWADRLTELLDAVWELRMLRGQESSLRGQISSVLGQRSSLQGQISSLRGQVSSMRGEISSWQGRESSLRGEISSIQGQLSSMRGRISSEQGQISSLESRRWDASDAERDRIAKQVEGHRAQIRAIEKEIEQFDAEARVREVEKRIEQTKVDERVAEVEKRIREFDVEKRVDEVGKAIVQLEVEKQVREFEREIASLEVERKARELETRVDQALRRFREVR